MCPKCTFAALCCWLCAILALPIFAQVRASVVEAARKSKEASSNTADKKKVLTNEDLGKKKECRDTSRAPKEVPPTDPVAVAFLQRIAGRWNFLSYHKGNGSWWRDGGSTNSKNEIHYLFGPSELLIEYRPELGVPTITDRFLYGSVHKVSDVLYDVELYKSSDPASIQTKRFKLSADGRTLGITEDAPDTPDPKVQDLIFINSKWAPAAPQQ